eukprot:970699-Alexandrium_andersonii.AAC.1
MVPDASSEDSATMQEVSEPVEMPLPSDLKCLLPTAADVVLKFKVVKLTPVPAYVGRPNVVLTRP